MKVVPHASLERKKTVFKRVDTRNLPTRRGNKKQKVDPSTKSTPVMVLDHPTPTTKSRAGTSPTHPSVNISKPSNAAPMTYLESEDLAWEKFNQAATDEDVAICCNMSMKKFGHSIVHDLFKVLQLVLSLIFVSLGLSFITFFCLYSLIQVMSKFMVTSKQAYKLDHTRVSLEAKICDMEKESSRRTGERMKLEAKVEELKNLVE